MQQYEVLLGGRVAPCGWRGAFVPKSMRGRARWFSPFSFLLVSTTGAFAAEAPAPATSCVDCHDVQVQAVEASVHGKGNASCTDCHGGNPERRPGSEPERVRKSKAHDASKGYNKVPASACAKCHEDAAASLEAGPHGPPRKAKNSPACWECHAGDLAAPKAHEMVKPTPALFETGCARCHQNRPDLVAMGLNLRAALEPAQQAVAEFAAGEGGEKNPLADEFHEALRLQHGLNKEEIAARAAGIVGRMPVERPWALAWLGVLWAVVAVLLGLITLKLKRLRTGGAP